jgi:hypothetical protein
MNKTKAGGNTNLLFSLFSLILQFPWFYNFLVRPTWWCKTGVLLYLFLYRLSKTIFSRKSNESLSCAKKCYSFLFLEAVIMIAEELCGSLVTFFEKAKIIHWLSVLQAVFSEGRVLLSEELDYQPALSLERYDQTIICAATLDKKYIVCRFKCDAGVQCSGQSASTGNMAQVWWHDTTQQNRVAARRTSSEPR